MSILVIQSFKIAPHQVKLLPYTYIRLHYLCRMSNSIIKDCKLLTMRKYKFWNQSSLW